MRADGDRAPSKSLLTSALRRKGAEYDQGRGEPDGYLPQVVVCQRCNSGFSRDETYLLCVLLAGSLNPDPNTHPEAANVLRSNLDIVRALRNPHGCQLFLFDDTQPSTLIPDSYRVGRVVLKDARGSASHELGEPLMDEPVQLSLVPLMSMAAEGRPSKALGAASPSGQRSAVA